MEIARHPAGGPSKLFDRRGGGVPYQQIKALVDRHSFHVVLHALCQVACDRGLIPIFHELTKIYEDTNPALRNADDPPLRNADDSPPKGPLVAGCKRREAPRVYEDTNPPPKGFDLDKLTDPERQRLLGDQ